jgi:type VI secretion system secreted protein Hcp
MCVKFLLQVTCLALMVCSPTTTMAAQKMYLVIDGVTGESNDVVYQNAIEVLAWSWSASNSGTTHLSSGGGAGASNFEDLSITKWVDTSSPILLAKIATGSLINSADLIVVREGTNPVEYFRLNLTNVIVSSLSTGGSVDGNRLTENISLNFAQFQVIYVPLNADGTAAASPVNYGWDIPLNSEL